MKLSKKEKVLLCTLGIIVLGYTYYEGVYVNLGDKLKTKQEEKDKIEAEYNNAIETINALDERKDEKILLCDKINDKTSIYYPTISQEHLILELDNLLKESELKGQYKFDSIEVKAIENMEKKQEELKKSSLSEISDDYKKIEDNYDEDENDSNADNNGNENKDAQVEENTETNNSESKKQDSSNSGDKGESIEQLKCTLTFEGTYEDLDKLLNLLNENEKKIIVTDINVSQKSMDEISGNMNLEFYAVPKITNEIQEYLEWSLENEYGKDNPFSGTSVGFNKESENADKSDFNIEVRSNTSVLPTLTIGKYGDDFKNTYVYSNKKSEENAEITISQNGDKYYYKYKTSKESYPRNYSGLGKEFAPFGENITINISSEDRVESDDNSGLNLSIINNTDLLTEVNVKDDDEENPRVTVNGDGSNISVNKK